jgi:hypothetical protein
MTNPNVMVKNCGESKVSTTKEGFQLDEEWRVWESRLLCNNFVLCRPTRLVHNAVDWHEALVHTGLHILKNRVKQ